MSLCSPRLVTLSVAWCASPDQWAVLESVTWFYSYNHVTYRGSAHPNTHNSAWELYMYIHVILHNMFMWVRNEDKVECVVDVCSRRLVYHHRAEKGG